MDFHVIEFANFLERLDPYPPITQKLKADTALRTGRPPRHENERDHMVNWFVSQTGTGHGQYSRRRPNHSARVTYNRLMTAPGLIWISEALNIDAQRSQRAVDIALSPGHVTVRCRAIRKLFPWPEIAEHTVKMVELQRTKKPLE